MATPDLQDHTQRAHSKLGASIAERWMNCPGSVLRSAGVEESAQTIFAAEGTAAHELGERCLRSQFCDAANFIGETIEVGEFKFEVDEEMAEAVQMYVDVIKGDYEPGDILLIEHRFDLTHVFPGMFGTGDAGIYKPRTKTLMVIDYKHGKGHSVEAANNPQLAYYGLGMIAVPSLKGVQIDAVELTIVQPRAPHRAGPVRRWLTDPVHLMDFQADLAEAAQRTQDPDAPLKAGDWCGWCPGKFVDGQMCPALHKASIADAMAEFADVVASALPDTRIAELLEKTDLIEDGIRAIRSEAFHRAQGGAKIPGWKLVQKRAQRKWVSDAPVIARRLAHDYRLLEDDIYDKKLRSPAQIEKLVPKPERAALADLVTAESSGTTLARETDRRAEAKPSRSATDDFND